MLSPTVLLCGPRSWDLYPDVLRNAGYRVTRVPGVAAVPRELTAQRPDLVVLDAEDRAADVHDVCRQIRAHGRVPIVVGCRPGADGRLDDIAQLMAYAAGADDVVPADVSPRVLLARVGAVLRRTVAGPITSARVRRVGPFELDPESRTASMAGNPLDLTRIEFDLLGILLENPSRVVPREELVSRVWGSWFGDDHVVEVHLSRLRAKIVRVGGPRIGSAVRGVGYRLGLDRAVAV
jgi:DNA-binding response OmpR family regulator